MNRWIVSTALIVTLALTVPSAAARPPFLVVVDAGHGGHDPGAKGFHGTLEKDLVLQIAVILRIKSFALPDLNIVLTRYEDTYLPLAERTAIANRLNADLYISIHANAHRDPNVKGIETLVAQKITGLKRSRSLNLARAIQARLIQNLSGTRTVPVPAPPPPSATAASKPNSSI